MGYNQKVKRKAEHERKKKTIKRTIKRVLLGIVAPIILTATIGLTVYTIHRYNIGNKLTDWDNIEYDLGDVEEGEVVPGMVTQTSYYKVRRAESMKNINKLQSVLPENVYGNLIKGLDSEYYKNVCNAEYWETVEDVKGLLAQSEYILKLYESYRYNDGFVDKDECNNDECQLKQFIESYTGDELRDYLLDVHQKWESLVAYYSTIVEVDDETLDMFYEEELCTNLEYIESINVRAYTLNYKLSTMLSSRLIEKLKNRGRLPYRDITINDTDGLKILSIYRSNRFYDGEFASLVPNTMISITGGNTNDTTIDLTGVEDVEGAIRDIEPPKKGKSGNKVKDLPYISFSLTEKSTEDVISVYYDILDIKHKENIPTMEELKDKLLYEARIYMAENGIEEIIDNMITEDIGG